jgi:serine/threonine protein kinase
VSAQPSSDDPGAPERIGRFEVRRPLGMGGMGEVYAAWDPVLQREVAVKLLRRDRVRPQHLEHASAMLRHEAQVAAKLTHPNVVAIFDVGDHDGSTYVAMELVDGPSLAGWIRATARTWREVLAMFFHAGRGLAAAHGVGLIHRDFKPTNVLVGQDHRPRVVDFGLAHFGAVPAGTSSGSLEDLLSTTARHHREPSESITTIGDGPGWDAAVSGVFDPGVTFDGGRLPRDLSITGSLGASVSRSMTVSRVDITTTSSSITSSTSLAEGSLAGERSITANPPEPTTTGLFVGTPAYMAPELYTGAGADARTDQFAFSVALYEGLYGERPFAGDTPREVAGNVMAGTIRMPPPRSRVPAWLRAIVVRGLAVRPEDRHASLNSQLAAIAFTSRVMWD